MTAPLAPEMVPLAPPATTVGGAFSRTAMGLARKASFTDVEKACLRALLVDYPEKESNHTKVNHNRGLINETRGLLHGEQGSSSREKTLDENILFQVPFSSLGERKSSRFGRHEKKILGLWQAHEDGVHPVIMSRRKSSGHLDKKYSSSRLSGRSYENPQCGGEGFGMDDSVRCSRTSSASAVTAAKSDIEVRPQREPDENSSWGEDDCGFVHYNAWEVLKDEYAEDFGFDFTETIHSIANTLDPNEDDDCQPHVFKILGTSADDVTAQPHVLSPPLMDSLLNFVPESISMENYWLKFSLIRDGASLYTLKQYLKATRYSILAIETSKGDVFGAFCSHTWRNHPTFFGSAPAFLWRMRHNRRAPCHSLFEQAQMESEIDVYAYSGLNDFVQVCDENRMAIGGGKLTPDRALFDDGRQETYLSPLEGIDLEGLGEGQNFGFGIALGEDLLSGTTSPCGTFRNPCLIDNMSKGEVFKVANLEIWAFTPCADVKSAERMEMTRFFVEESVRSASATSSTNDIYSNPFSSQDEFQREFYRRIGQNQPSGHHRNGSFEHKYIVAPSSRR